MGIYDGAVGEGADSAVRLLEIIPRTVRWRCLEFTSRGDKFVVLGIDGSEYQGWMCGTEIGNSKFSEIFSETTDFFGTVFLRKVSDFFGVKTSHLIQSLLVF